MQNQNQILPKKNASDFPQILKVHGNLLVQEPLASGRLPMAFLVHIFYEPRWDPRRKVK
jgi:hypothetical protein